MAGKGGTFSDSGSSGSGGGGGTPGSPSLSISIPEHRLEPVSILEAQLLLIQ